MCKKSTYEVIRMLHWHGFKAVKLTPVQEWLMPSITLHSKKTNC